VGYAGRRVSSAPRWPILSLGGVEIQAGQRVGMFYSSANFDPGRFRGTGNALTSCVIPIRMSGSAGTGAHYLPGGETWARMEINLIFNAIADHMPNIQQGGRACAPPVGVDQRHQALRRQVRLTE